MYSVITDAASNEVMAAFDAPLVGNRKINPSIRYAGAIEGKNTIIVSVEPWAGPVLAGVLRRLGAWFDRAAPQGRIPRGQPIVGRAGASQVRNQRFDRVDRKDRKIRRAMKAAQS
jgi:hypothetical protein